MGTQKDIATTEDIIKEVASRHKGREKVKKITRAYFDEIKQALMDGRAVRIKYFGLFKTTQWKPYSGYDLHRKKFTIKKTRTAHFKASKFLEEKVF